MRLIEKKIGGNHSGSWIHPDLAVQLAQWISPVFAIQVSRWIRQLFSKGTVALDNIKQKLLRAEEELKIEREEREKAEQRVLRMKDFVENRRKLERKEVLYLGTSKAYQSNLSWLRQSNQGV